MVGFENNPGNATGRLGHPNFFDKCVIDDDCLVQQSRRHFRVMQIKINSGGIIDRVRFILHLIFEINYHGARFARRPVSDAGNQPRCCGF